MAREFIAFPCFALALDEIADQLPHHLGSGLSVKRFRPVASGAAAACAQAQSDFATGRVVSGAVRTGGARRSVPAASGACQPAGQRPRFRTLIERRESDAGYCIPDAAPPPVPQNPTDCSDEICSNRNRTCPIEWCGARAYIHDQHAICVHLAERLIGRVVCACMGLFHVACLVCPARFYCGRAALSLHPPAAACRLQLADEGTTGVPTAEVERSSSPGRPVRWLSCA